MPAGIREAEAGQCRFKGCRLVVNAARIVFPPEDRAEVAAAVAESLTTGALTLGPYTRQFEAAFAAAHDAPNAIAVTSGTAALEIILRAVGVDGKDVIVPANTFYATAAAVIQAGGRPVFADIDAATFALTPETVTAALTPNTGAVVMVHIAGLIAPQTAAVRDLCEQHGVEFIEDAAHAHGSTYDGKFAGSLSTAASFSFYPTKVVTSGEGGMIATASGPLADEARIYRDQGKGAFNSNHHTRLGYAWRISEQNAATGLVHLRRLDEFIERRREVAARYDKALAGLEGLEPLTEPAGCRGNIYKYIVLLPRGTDRAWFKQQLADKHQVRLAGEVYDTPLHHQPVLAEFAGPEPLPVAEDMCDRHVCLPVHSDMRDDEIDEVLTAVAAVYGELHGS
jgi:perosamine synthetase